MAETIEKSLLDLDFASLTRRTFTPSPAAWEDQVLYFLLLDRFSEGRERDGYRDNEGRPVRTGVTPLYRPEDSGQIDYDTWFRAGGGWQGGTLKGLRSKLGYLRRLGITALWISPVFRQVAFEPTYHGYGIQNFLDVDPHFGTRRSSATSSRPPTSKGSTSSSTSSPTTPATSSPTPRTATRRTIRLRAESCNDPRWDGKPLRRPGLQRPRRPADAAL